MGSPVYLGFDLSTQQLKCIAVTSDLKLAHLAKFDFDADQHGFHVRKGVMTNPEEGEVFAPVALWMQALDAVLDRLRQDGLDMKRVEGISGSGMQHGSVFWNHDAEKILANLDPEKPLQDQLVRALASPYSPNWQDAATEKECQQFDAALGNPDELARRTGSKAHHRFTGPQILRLRHKFPERYRNTARISLVSSWIATVFLGKFAPFDISDVCGMNLRDIQTSTWNEKLLELTAGKAGVEDLKQKLGNVPEDGGTAFGTVCNFFVQRHGFSPTCKVIASTGDNPATLLALPLRENDAIVSLGTSSTFLMVTPHYKPDTAYHFFNSPTTPGLYMFMLCYKNGGLAREKVRDAINVGKGLQENSMTWEHYDRAALETPPLGKREAEDPFQLGLYFPRHEIVPNLPPGEWHYEYDPKSDDLQPVKSNLDAPFDHARKIVESQFLSMRLRSHDLVKSPGRDLPPQPRRIYLVGGGSKNRAIARICGEVLGGLEGVYKLDVGENACGLGAAHKAVWACERADGQTFENFIGERWNEERFAQRLCDGYQKGIFEQYGEALRGFEKMEQDLLSREKGA